MRTIGSLVGKHAVLLVVAVAGAAAAMGGCSSAPAPAERTASEDEAMLVSCPANEVLECNWEYVCGATGCRLAKSCDCVCPYTMCGTSCVDTSSNPNDCGTCGNVCLEGTTCTAGACVYPACVYTPPPTCTTPPPPDTSPSCDPANQQTCSPGQTGGSFTTCPLSDGTCPNVNNFETELSKLACRPGGNPSTGQRTIVCYNPPNGFPPGVKNRDGTFACGYGNDWLFAVCPVTNPTTGKYQYQDIQALASHYDYNSCQPVAPVTLSCPDTSGDVVNIVVYYDPSCAGRCG